MKLRLSALLGALVLALPVVLFASGRKPTPVLPTPVSAKLPACACDTTAKVLTVAARTKPILFAIDVFIEIPHNLFNLRKPQNIDNT